MATAMEVTGGDEVAESVKFMRNMDKFFDCLNVSNCATGKKQKKAFKLPYKSASDFRLKV